MLSCEFILKVQAYHDGEVDADTARRFEAHLADCAECVRELQALRSMSAWLSRLPLAEPSAAVMARLHEEVTSVMERSLLRLAMSFASIAAVVLIAATVGLLQLQPQSAAAPQPWEGTAIAMQQSDASASSASVAGIEPELIAMDLSRKAMP